MSYLILLFIKLSICLSMLLYGNIIGADLGFLQTLRKIPASHRVKWTPVTLTSGAAVVALLYNYHIICPSQSFSYETADVLELQIFFVAIGMAMLEHCTERAYLARQCVVTERPADSLFSLSYGSD